MKRFILIYIVASVVVLTLFLLIAWPKDPASPSPVDTVAVNEIAMEAALNWDDPAALERIGFAYSFFITNNAGEVLYSSGGDMPDNAQSAIRRGFLPVNIESGGRIVGSALIETHPADSYSRETSSLRTAAIVSISALLALNLAFFASIYRSIIRPFRRVERFAHKISAGILDEPLPADDKNPFGLFTHSFDIMRDSLLEASQKQLKAERDRKELVASLSHDIKTPLTTIRLVTELLQVSADTPATREKLGTIEAKVNQIDRLMNDMLLSALDELGELAVTTASEDSGVLLSLLQSADHASKARFGTVPPCMVEVDVARMEQVIGNVIANSYKYAGTAIDVSFAVVGEGLQIDVEDYGDGVDPETLELITTKFYRGQNAIASQKEGEGLGLFIAKQLMEKMGGGLEALSRDDGFTIRLWLRLSR